jgi:hypothetical protein
MKWLVYEGPHLEVEVPHDNVTGGVIVAEHGKAVQVPDDIADSLLTHGEENADQIDVDPDTGKPVRAPQHNRTWRTATAKETKAADTAAADTAEEVNG